jgi:hypothetical protein
MSYGKNAVIDLAAGIPYGLKSAAVETLVTLAYQAAEPPEEQATA